MDGYVETMEANTQACAEFAELERARREDVEFVKIL